MRGENIREAEDGRNQPPAKKRCREDLAGQGQQSPGSEEPKEGKEKKEEEKEASGEEREPKPIRKDCQPSTPVQVKVKRINLKTKQEEAVRKT